jgi:HSP20 family molecular chaperone IbpA
MRLSEFNEQTDGLVRRYEYGDENVVVADLGVSDEPASVDVVDGTAVSRFEDEDGGAVDHVDGRRLVLESGDGEPVQKELKLPDGEVAKALINNGVVTIEVSL